MRIVALDTAVSTFDGLSFDVFKELGELRCYDRSAPGDVQERARGAEALLVNKVVVSAELLAGLPALRYVGVTATGTNNVDLAACRARGIAVANVTHYSTDSVAQLVFAFIFDHFVNVPAHRALVRRGEWVKSPDFCVPAVAQREIAALTLGIVGMGDIGSRVAELGRAFGLRVLAGAVPGREYLDGRIELLGLLPQVDVLSLHCALSETTAKMINHAALALMRPSAVLINVARGGLVDEDALAAALGQGRLAAYYADVLSSEPPKADNPLLSAPRATLTPHIAWATPEARARLIHESYLNLKAFLNGERRNRVE